MQCYKFLFIFVRLWRSFFLLLNPFPLIPVSFLKIVSPSSPCNTWQTIPLFGGSSRPPSPRIQDLNYVSFSPLATGSSQPLTNNFSWQKNHPPPFFIPHRFSFCPSLFVTQLSYESHVFSVNRSIRDSIYFAFYRASSEIVQSIILHIHTDYGYGNSHNLESNLSPWWWRACCLSNSRLYDAPQTKAMQAGQIGNPVASWIREAFN